MFYTIIYKNLSENQKLNIFNFIKENFPDITNFGMEQKTIIIVNYENEKIIGCVCLLNNNCLQEILIKAHVNLNDYIFDYDNGLFLYNFCVSSHHRNKKIGTKLIDLTLELCKQIGIDYIYCHAVNEISRNLFLHKGFFIYDNILTQKNNKYYKMLKFI